MSQQRMTCPSAARANERRPSDPRPSGTPDAATPKAGDLAYYAPWGNLALFHRDGRHSPGLVILGRLNDGGDTERLATADRITIETLS